MDQILSQGQLLTKSYAPPAVEMLEAPFCCAPNRVIHAKKIQANLVRFFFNPFETLFQELSFFL